MLREQLDEEKIMPQGQWAKCLLQVRQTDTRKLPANKSILVLGDNETGKTTLVAKLAYLETPKKGFGMEYNFIEIRDEYREDSTKLGVWILDGDLRHVPLLKFALTEENFDDSCCLLVASMSHPWKIMKSLETWASVLEQHIETLNIKPTKLKQCRQKQLFKFMNYVASSNDPESRLIANLETSALKLENPTDGDENNKSNTDEFHDAAQSVDTNQISRGDTLSKNLGFEIIVVITKTDHISTLEKDYDYTEETFDFIQQAIRKFCLQYGASLFYVSAKVNKNCDLLHKYIAHRIYDLPFKFPASVVERDAIFVPAGWDDKKKISILYDNIKSVDPDVNYNSFITERQNPGPAQRNLEVEVESDQEFLLRMQNDLGKQVQPTLPSAPSPVQARQNISAPIDGQPSGEGVLQNFFNSLLSKGRAMPPSGGQQDT